MAWEIKPCLAHPKTKDGLPNSASVVARPRHPGLTDLEHPTSSWRLSMRIKLLVAAATLLARVTAFAADPPVTFQTQPAGRILDDARAIAKMVGGDKAAAEFNDGLKEKLGEKGFTRPRPRPADPRLPLLADKIEDTVGVLVVPVTGEKEFLAVWSGSTAQAEGRRQGALRVPAKVGDKGVS